MFLSPFSSHVSGSLQARQQLNEEPRGVQKLNDETAEA